MKASIKQISEITGFSPATISRCAESQKRCESEDRRKNLSGGEGDWIYLRNKITKIKLVIYKRNGLIIDDSPFFPILLKGVRRMSAGLLDMRWLYVM